MPGADPSEDSCGQTLGVRTELTGAAEVLLGMTEVTSSCVQSCVLRTLGNPNIDLCGT